MADISLETEGDSAEYTSSEPVGANQSIDPNSVKGAVLKQSQVLGGQSRMRQESVSVLVNAGPAAQKKQQAVTVPDLLPEVPGTAYAKGKPYPITLVVIDNKFMLQKAAGYDFYLMRRAALEESKIVLRINSAFRTHEEQIAIAEKHRLNPNLGPAATPGFSNHQQGLSLDISTGISFTDWKSGLVKTSPVHTWLTQNAHRFGFNQRDLALLPDGRRWEPWHWTHTDDQTIHGIDDVSDELTDLYSSLLTAGVDTAYTADGAPDIFRLILKLGHDTARSVERSVSAWTSSRDIIHNAAAAQSVLMSADQARKVAALGAPLQMTPPAGFGSAPPLYDFETGLWLDGDENGLGV